MSTNEIAKYSEIKTAIQDIADRSAKQRVAYEEAAVTFSRINKILTVFAGVLSLLAAGSIASALTKLLDPRNMQILAVCSATVSALTSALVSSFVSDRRIGKLFSISIQYLQIKEAAMSALVEPGLSAKTLHTRLQELKDKYINVAERSTDVSLGRYRYDGQFTLRDFIGFGLRNRRTQFTTNKKS